MMILIISECEKKALKRTRRVLDAFANRIGNNTWQTVITEDGLKAMHTLLRRSASKNTAVSCHWLRSRSRSDLLWVVGNRSAFDEAGQVPVNRTRRSLIPQDWQNNWSHAQSIQIVATIAALLHDIGKSTIGFQHKLFSSQAGADPFRHEWISLRLFLWLIEGCTSDDEWLKRFCDLNAFLEKNPLNQEQLDDYCKVDSQASKIKLSQYPPLAQWVAWLIVTHHRLPPLNKTFISSLEKHQFRKTGHAALNKATFYFYQNLKAHDFWVKNPKSIEQNTQARNQSFWRFDSLVIHSHPWQSQLKRYCAKAMADAALNDLLVAAEPKNPINDPWLLLLSRLCLMVGDHNYSSLPKEDPRRVKGSPQFTHLIANTERLSDRTGRSTHEPKQALDEHLLGVAGLTARFARVLPQLKTVLPRISDHPQLVNNTTIERFKWQNQACSSVKQVREKSDQHGFFGVNLASTGSGKTIANARIMHALSDPKLGSRFTIALGLRVLTLQTGKSLRKDLDLADDQLGILIGSSAHQSLYELNETATESNPHRQDSYGSESAEELLSEWVDSGYELHQYEELGLGTVIENTKARQLLFSPIISCTVDHLIQASECQRGGAYIAPMLRLLSSELILDEPDDFSPSDLPALSRLVHLAGVFGARVLLSSATLPPDMLSGLFESYRSGRQIHNHHLKLPAPKVVCAWFDENHSKTHPCQSAADFSAQSRAFAAKRARYLSGLPIRRRAGVLPVNPEFNQERPEQFYAALARALITKSLDLHRRHKLSCPSGNSLSVGVIRIANIKHIVGLAQAIYADDYSDLLGEISLNLATYHARQLLALRNQLENGLDSLLKRSSNEQAIFKLPSIKEAFEHGSKDQLFVVLASPVCEVGRDIDFDWAIAEPSSMRSIIQLAGRIWRHRPGKVAAEANLAILQKNLNQLTGASSGSIYARPGYESKDHKLTQHSIDEVMTLEQLSRVDSLPRLIKPESLKPTERLADLEHQVMAELFGTQTQEKTVVTGYFSDSDTSSRMHTHLPQITPFRAGQQQTSYIARYETTGDIQFYLSDEVYDRHNKEPSLQNHVITRVPLNCTNPAVKPWLNLSLHDALERLSEQLGEKDWVQLENTYSTVALENSTQGWLFNETLGFWRQY